MPPTRKDMGGSMPEVPTVEQLKRMADFWAGPDRKTEEAA